MSNNGYPTQRNPRRYSTPLGWNFQGNPNDYRQRVPPGTYGGGTWRPPNSTTLPEPEPRIPQWNGKLRRKPKGTDWYGLAGDIYDGLRKGHVNIRKYRAYRHALEPIIDIAIDAALDLLDPRTGLIADISAARMSSEYPAQRISGWQLKRVCMADLTTLFIASNALIDPGCLLNQAGAGTFLGHQISPNAETIILGRPAVSPGRMDTVQTWWRPAGYAGRSAAPWTARGGVINPASNPIYEAMAALAPGLFKPPVFKRGYVAPLNRPRIDHLLEMWPQSRQSGYGATAPLYNPALGGPTVIISPNGNYTGPTVGLPNPPGPKRKERKATMYGLDNQSLAGRIVGAVGEFGDFVESFYETLPDWCKVGDRTLQDKVATLYQHWDKVDLARAFNNLVLNQAEDAFFGRLGQLTGKANRVKPFGGAGLMVGPAL